jgi:tRNA (guanine-N7-)-methyltransferase
VQDLPNLTPTDQPPHRRIKSFVLRAGRTTTGQARALSELGPHFLVPFQNSPLHPTSCFGSNVQQKPVVLEIGFGMGEATAAIAHTLPDVNFLACEVHPPGVGALLQRIEDQGLKNLRIVNHDAVEVIDHMLPDGSLDGVHIFFPDPWHKKRHNKRRLIQAPFVGKLCAKLKVGGYLHIATDWQPYAEQILATCLAEQRLVNTGNLTDGYATKPHYRPLTKFENRGIKLGHGVWDIVFKRC